MKETNPRIESLADAVRASNTGDEEFEQEEVVFARRFLAALDWAKENGELGQARSDALSEQVQVNQTLNPRMFWMPPAEPPLLPGVDKVHVDPSIVTSADVDEVLLDANIITQADIDARIELTPEDVGRTVIDDHDVEWEIMYNRGGHYACWSETRGMRVFAKNGYLVRDTNSARHLARWNTGDSDG